MNFIKDFKGFISKGNVFDMAVGISWVVLSLQ